MTFIIGGNPFVLTPTDYIMNDDGDCFSTFANGDIGKIILKLLCFILNRLFFNKYNLKQMVHGFWAMLFWVFTTRYSTRKTCESVSPNPYNNNTNT